MSAPVFARRVELQLDSVTLAEIERLRLATTPPRLKSEMLRHLLRLGLREYRASQPVTLHVE